MTPWMVGPTAVKAVLTPATTTTDTSAYSMPVWPSSLPRRSRAQPRSAGNHVMNEPIATVLPPPPGPARRPTLPGSAGLTNARMSESPSSAVAQELRANLPAHQALALATALLTMPEIRPRVLWIVVEIAGPATT